MHCALIPQEPGHGSRHFSRIQALLLEHSEFIEHSGRQFGGDPVYVWRHEHDGDPLKSRHSENGPHGEGWQGLRYSSCFGGKTGAIEIWVKEQTEDIRISNQTKV